RTVKRSRANDSRHLACESRSSSDSLSVPRSTLKPPPKKRGFFYFHLFKSGSLATALVALLLQQDFWIICSIKSIQSVVSTTKVV
ncbi:MAG: hypothetical protein ACYCWB_01705, partial [Thiobacillus sp.]